MGVQEVGLHPPGRTYEAREQRRNQERQPRSAAQVGDDAVAVGDPEVAELLGPDDLDLDATRTNVLNGVGDEAPGDVRRKAWVRRR